jgi:hypothetical protein
MQQGWQSERHLGGLELLTLSERSRICSHARCFRLPTGLNGIQLDSRDAATASGQRSGLPWQSSTQRKQRPGATLTARALSSTVGEVTAG